MKKSLYFAIFAVFAFFIPIFATTMCTINDSVAVILDPSIAGTAGGVFDRTLGTWSVTFPYGTIYGISACVDTDWGKSRGNYIKTLTDTNGTRVYGNEALGQYCWCKMTHPVASRWVFDLNRSSTGCNGGNCANFCGIDTRNMEVLRVGLFGSVQQ